MVLNLGQRWAREENKAANDLLDTALELSQISMLMYACGEERGECTKGGKPGNGNISVWANLFLAFLLPSLSLFFFSSLSLLGNDSHLLCPDTTISHQKHTVTLMSSKLFCVRSLHYWHLFFGAQDSNVQANAVMENKPITKQGLLKSSRAPMTCW